MIVDAELSNRVGEADERFVPGVSRGQLIELEHLVRYWWVSALAEGRRVLDAGCGVGYGTALLANAGARDAVGVDLSASAIAAAVAGATGEFLEGDVRSLPFDDGTFDLVVCFEVIEHLEGRDDAIAELARVLAPGGILAISSPNRDVYPSGNPHHVHEYLPEELREALDRSFDHVALYRQHDWIASAVLNDEHVADGTMHALGDLKVGKALSERPGSETYTVALASSQPLPALPARALLGGLGELREWVLMAPVLEACTAERDHARADVAELLAEVDALHARIAQIHRDVHGSLSWRLTRPLRALAALARRIRGTRRSAGRDG